MAGAVAMALVSFGANANQGRGQGQVNFKGTVIDAPCGIAPESADQTIDFSQISKAHLTNGGTSQHKNVDIKLVNCDLAGQKNCNYYFLVHLWELTSLMNWELLVEPVRLSRCPLLLVAL